MDEAAYLTKVRQVLDELGSNDSSADVTGSGDYWKHCRQVGIDAKVCAATIYSGVRHRHEVARTVIKENASAASEAPVREEWEVVVKRAGVSPDDITSAAGRRPDEVTAGNAVFAGFKDDEKAASFSKKMTKAGYISSFGPRRDYTLHEAAERTVSKRQALGALMLNWHSSQGDPLYAVGSYYIGDMKYPRQEMVESAKNKASSLASRLSNSPEKRELRRIVRGLEHYELVDYPYGPQAMAEETREWSKVTLNSEADARALRRQLEGKYTVDRLGANIWTTASYDVVLKALDKAGVKGHIHRETEEAAESPAAATPVAVEECASCIPWQKVSRDSDAAAANTELSKKYGAIKNAKDVYRVVGDAMNKEDQEVFLVIPLDLRGELKAAPYEVARGQYSRVAVGVENVMAAVYAAHCEAFVVVHNHPSGRVSPSAADKHLTESIRDAVKPLGKGVTFVDHCIVGSGCIYSITEKRKYTV